jgi:ligand-binding sensor domain-containing protein
MRIAVLTVVLVTLLGAPSSADEWDIVYVPNDAKIYDIGIEGSTIWMSTQGHGLIGHDGSLWVVHLAGDHPGDPTRGIRTNAFNYTLLVDRAGDKWIGRDQRKAVDRLDDAGTFAKDDDAWFYYTRDEEMVSDRIFSMAEDCDGNKWFGIVDQGGTEDSTVELLVENDDTTSVDDEWFAYDNTSTPDSTFFSADHVTAVAVDHSCRLWIGYFATGVDVWDYGNPRTFADDDWAHYTDADGLPNNQVLAFRVGPDGRVWTGTTAGLAVFDPTDGAWQSVEGLPGIQARAIDIDAHGHVWVGTENGVAMLYSNGRVARIHEAEAGPGSIEHAEIVDLVVDQSDGRVWVVSRDEGSDATALNVFESGFEPLPPPEERDMYAYPNPWTAGSSKGMVNMFGPTEGSTVEIFDVTGELVRELPRTEPYVWDTLDQSFNEVPSGLYVARVETPDGGVTFLKLAIVR